MKKIILLLSIFCSGLPLFAQDDWTAVGDLNFTQSDDQGVPEIAFLPSEKFPYYATTDSTGVVEVYQFDGLNWSNIFPNNISGANCTNVHLAVNPTNQHLTLAYIDASDSLAALEMDGSYNWGYVFDTPYKFAYTDIYEMDFGFAPVNHRPNFAFSGLWGTQTQGRVYYYVSGSGYYSTAAQVYGYDCEQIELDFVPNTNEIVVTFIKNTDNNNVKVKHYSGGMWTEVGGFNSIAGYAEESSTIVLAGNDIFTTFRSYINVDKIYVYHFDGSSWYGPIAGVINGYHPQLERDTINNINYLAFSNTGTNELQLYRMNVINNWQNLTASSTTFYGKNISLAINPLNGDPTVGTISTSTVGESSVVRFGCSTGTIDAGQDVVTCPTGIANISLTGTTPGAYATWSGGVINGVNFTAPYGLTQYVYSALHNGCIVSDTAEVSAFLPNIIAGPDTVSICQGDSMQLYAVGGSTYQWNPGGLNNGDYILPVDGDVYTVTGADANGCENTDAIYFSVDPQPNQPTISVGNGVLTTDNNIAYQWYLDGVYISGAITQDIVPTANGTYTVQVFNSNGCSNWSDPFVFNSLGVDDDLDSQVLSLYPNPTQSAITVMLPNGNLSGELFIYNLQGKMVLSRILNSNSTEIDLDLPNGVYMVNVKVEGHVFVQKLVKF
ncbi:MAG: T9SS type A sorting domain-containing protein [Putridiphycobacter sp.]